MMSITAAAVGGSSWARITWRADQRAGGHSALGVALDDVQERGRSALERLGLFGLGGVAVDALGAGAGLVAGRLGHLHLFVQAVDEKPLRRGDVRQVETDGLLDIEFAGLLLGPDFCQGIVGLAQLRKGCRQGRDLA
jgi:hypothetical protein